MQDFELVRLRAMERLAHERFLHLGRPNGLGEPTVLKAAKDICVEVADAVRLHKSRRINQVKSADHHQGCQRHHCSGLDRDRARRALLLGAGWLGALAMLTPDAVQAQQGPFIYVPNLSGSDVSVIDTPTNTVAPTAIPVGSVALAAAVRGDQSWSMFRTVATTRFPSSTPPRILWSPPSLSAVCPHSSLSLLTTHAPTWPTRAATM